MNPDSRSHVPLIRRAWDARAGRFVWECNPEPPGRWGLGLNPQTKADWRQAAMWCHRQNAKQTA